MGKLVNKYTEILHMFGFEVTSDGYIKSINGTRSMVVSGKSLVMPTQEHVKTLGKTKEDGSVEVIKTLFNPLDENVLKGENPALTKLKDIVTARLGDSIFRTADLLLRLADNPKMQKKTPLIINEFLMGLNDLNTTNVKKMVDPKAVDTFTKMYEKSTKDLDKIIKIFLKKGGKHNNKTFNRLAVVDFPMLRKIKESKKGDMLYGYRLRTKDVNSFTHTLSYVIGDLETDGMMHYGCNDNEHPAFISLMSIFLKIGTRVNSILDKLKGVDAESVSEAKFDMCLTEEDLRSLDQYKGELSMIPNYSEVSKEGFVPNNTPTVIKAVGNQDMSNKTGTPIAKEKEDNIPAVHKILYGGKKPMSSAPSSGFQNNVFQKNVFQQQSNNPFTAQQNNNVFGNSNGNVFNQQQNNVFGNNNPFQQQSNNPFNKGGIQANNYTVKQINSVGTNSPFLR